jgi:hypothetical protein
MDLIDRYLASVRRHLPRDAQDDIIHELSDSLRSEAEEREREAGHALTDDEQAALLKKHGHPWVMAARYAPKRSLIGPELFPYYRQALSIVLLWVVFPITLVSGVMAGYPMLLGARMISEMIATAWNGAIFAIGIVTLVFFVLERARVRITALDNWDPKRLPEYRVGRLLPRSETLPSLVFTVLFLLWWIGVLQMPYFAWHNGERVQLVATAIWSEIYTPVLILAIACVIGAVVDVVRPWRTLLMSAADMTLNAAAFATVIWLLRMRPQFVEVAGTAASAETVMQATRFVNSSLTWGLVALAAVIAIDTLYELWQVMRSRGRAAKAVSV